METTVYFYPDRYELASSHYSEEWVAFVKNYPIRHYNSDRKTWSLPLHAVPGHAASYFDSQFSSFGSVKCVPMRGIQVTEEEVFNKYPFLMPHQIEAATKAINRRTYLLNHSLGSGKTITSYVAAKEIAAKMNSSVLVVSPASIIPQWVQEIKKWFNDDLIPIRGTVKKRQDIWNSRPKYAVISYESFRQDIIHFIALGIKPVLIADEVSKLRGKSNLHKTFKEIAKHTNGIIACSGTPISGRLEQYQRIMSFLNPVFMSYDYFNHTYPVVEEFILKANPTRGRYQDRTIRNVIGYKNVDDFIAKLDLYYDLKTKEDIGIKMPPMSVVMREVAMSRDQQHLHKVLMEHAKEIKSVLPVWSLLHVCSSGVENLKYSSSELLNKLNVVIPDTVSPKLVELMDILEEIGDKKVLVFTQYSTMAHNAVITINAAAGKEIALVATGEDHKQRDLAVERFKNDTSIQVLVATDTLSMGLSLPTVDYEIMLDLSESISTHEQRIGRIFRLNSPVDKPKTVIVLFSNGIELDIKNILFDKAILNEKLQLGISASSIDVKKEVMKKYGFEHTPLKAFVS